MDAYTLISIGSIGALLIASAFMSGSETALTATSRPRIHHLARSGNLRARVVNWLLDRREQLISTILLGNNIVNILASSIATSIFLELFGQAGVAVATAVMTVLIVAFGEVLPKTYAIRNADRVSLAVSHPLRVVYWILAPLNAAFFIPIRFLLRTLSRNRPGAMVSPIDEIRGTVALHASSGALYKHDRDMIESVLELSEIEVGDIMVHRTDMVSVDIDLSTPEIIAALLACPYSRVPLWKDNAENIIGVLHVKDVLRALQEQGGDPQKVDIRALTLPPWFVPETTTLREQLNAFRRRHQYLALVVDEYGTLKGVVSLADILEEIVGDLAPAPERPEERDYRKLPDGRYIVAGRAAVRDLNRDLEWNLPDDEATTIAGLVIKVAEALPEVGESHKIGGFSFEVLRRSNNQITTLRITPPARPAERPSS